jgi:hypothetical protein
VAASVAQALGFHGPSRSASYTTEDVSTEINRKWFPIKEFAFICGFFNRIFITAKKEKRVVDSLIKNYPAQLANSGISSKF